MSRLSTKGADGAAMLGTVSGSYRKFWWEVKAAVDALTALGVDVLSPQGDEIGEHGEFVRLSGDSGSNGEIEAQHLDAIGRSDFLFVVDPDGYVGQSTALEVGFSVAAGVPVYCTETPADAVLAHFVTGTGTPGAAAAAVAAGGRSPFPRQGNLGLIQRYVRAVGRERGFDLETPGDVFVLLVEEVGELARHIRMLKGLSTEIAAPGGSDMAEELADCFLYLVDLSNLVGVDLGMAAADKEEVNAARVWKRDERRGKSRETKWR